ncbi:copper-transporting P-type ATPase [Helicobacter mustelae]|uniref:heavy metal translocating P-type ATPase n=1 Tax=Helicobacter mustelae TaxID=217 RepID=UPI000DFF9C94|nr:copper-translocating P-type ATPase [Helicobacter mustelae]STP12125.1 copper-transporting P-type ATPase [Helicobacter mustelae]
MKEAYFKIKGMSCSSCSSGIERSLGRKSGVQKIEVNLVGESAHVQYDESKITLEAIFSQISKMGYEPSDKEEKKLSWIQKFDELFLTPQSRVILAMILSAMVLTLSMLPLVIPMQEPLFGLHVNVTLQLILTLIVMHLGRHFYIRGFGALLHSTPNMDTLVALGSGVSFLYSLFIYVKIMFDHVEYPLYFESVCVILAFILLGKYLESYAKNKSLEQLNLLFNFYQKTTLRLQEDNSYQEVLVKDVVAGDVLKVLPGGTIPVDSLIIEGGGNVDESMLSGESVPVYKKVDDQVFAGSVMLDQGCILRAQKDSRHSTIAEVLKLVRKAQDSKAPVARLADVVSGYFVPFVLLIGLIFFVFWWVYRGDFAFALEVFVSILVVSCPCALGLATPMAILIASTRGAKNSLLFKNAKALENTHKVQKVLFDKTGTLTEGRLEISEIKSYHKDFSARMLLQIASSLEDRSEHPIAKAILKFAEEKGVQKSEVMDFENTAGMGVAGRLEGVMYKIGKKDFFDASIAEEAHLTSVFVARVIDGKEELLGVLFLEDKIREDARGVIDFLKSQNIGVMMLSGDQEGVVQSVAQKLGITEYFGNLKPHQKYEIIENLKSSGQRVMMVGDGLNDAPALALADISLAMGGGNDLSQERADVVVLNNQIKGVVNAIKLSHQTLRNIKQNLFWAFFYNIIAISIAGGILYHLGFMLNPMVAAFAMSLSSLSVILNAQRLRFFKF